MLQGEVTGFGKVLMLKTCKMIVSVLSQVFLGLPGKKMCGNIKVLTSFSLGFGKTTVHLKTSFQYRLMKVTLGLF